MTDRVLQLLGPSTGGIRRHVAQLRADLPGHGWDVTVAGPMGVMDHLGGQDAVVDVPDGLQPVDLWRSRRAVADLGSGVDIIHAHGLTPGWIAALARQDRPVVVTVHNLVLDEVRGRWQGPVLRRFEGLLPGRVDAVVAVSEGIARRFDAAPNVWMIPPAGPPPRPTRSPAEVRAQLGVAEGQPLVVSVARLNPQKDLPTFLRAMVYVKGEIPDVHAVVVGEGRDAAALHTLTAELGLSAPGLPTVDFVGAIANGADALAAADVVVVTSRWESGPLVLFEAMLLGRPVVTTPVGMAPELVEDRNSGRVVPVGDVEAIAGAIVEMLRDRDAAAAMAAAGCRVATDKVGAARLVSAVADVYRATLGR